MKKNILENESFAKPLIETKEDIYPMPIFCSLTVNNIQKTVDWYSQTLGFRSIFSLNDPTTKELIFVHLRREKYQDILLHQGRVDKEKNRGGISITFQAWCDIDSLTDQAKKHHATVITEPHNTPWNTREVTFEDSDGYRINFTYLTKQKAKEMSDIISSFKDKM